MRPWPCGSSFQKREAGFAPSSSVRCTPFRVVDLKISRLLRLLSAAACLLFSTVVIAACLVLSAPAWGETDEHVASSTPEVSGIAEARSLIQEGKYDEALAILRPLAQDREVDGSVLFQIGLAATGASQQPGLADDQRKALLDEAIGAFLTMLIDRPGLVRVRLELALAPDTNIGGTSDERIIHICRFSPK